MKSLNNKVKNADRRFRQGRLSYKKLKTILNGELTKYMGETKALQKNLQTKIQELKKMVSHTHDENCHHDEVSIEEPTDYNE